MKDSITQGQLKEVLDYEPTTGVFTAKKLRPHPTKGLCYGVGGIDINGYVLIMVLGKQYRAHRLVWLWVHGEFPSQQLDHINGVRHDNRLCNLRPATNSENCKNGKLPKNNTSGFKGVSWMPRQKAWAAHIRVDGKAIHLGLYRDVVEAAETYDAAAAKYFGGFARTNRQLGLLEGRQRSQAVFERKSWKLSAPQKQEIVRRVQEGERRVFIAQDFGLSIRGLNKLVQRRKTA